MAVVEESLVRVWERTSSSHYRYCACCGADATHCCYVKVSGVPLITYVCGEHATQITGGAV